MAKPTPAGRRSAHVARMLGATALSLGLASGAAAQTGACALVNGLLPPGCEEPNRTTVVDMPVGENTEAESGSGVGAEGFSIAIDGARVTGDPRVEDMARRADVALADANIEVKFDGLGVTPRLELSVTGTPRGLRAGDSVTFASATNYPAFLERGEVRLIDLAARGGPRTIAVVPLEPNGEATTLVPEGEDVVAVHRVYDRQGRFDETAPLELATRDDRGLKDGVEEGSDSTARRGIPVSGGAVTVFGSGLAPGAEVRTLGESVRAAPDGDFVIQRILPLGSYDVDVSAGGQTFTRQVVIPRSEWFGVGVADLTFGWRRAGGQTEDYQTGRLSFFTRGKTGSGLTVTASADTGEGDVRDLFRSLDEKDPRSLLLRIDPDDYYPVYGDDSTMEEAAPTSGRFYLKVEQDGNHLVWGNFRNSLGGGQYIRNERTLYGLQGVWKSGAQTPAGEPRAAVTVYGASPDNLPQRDRFLGTGGSVYFLKRQDISIGSETVSVEIRDPDTGRVVGRQPLVFGRDYDINYVQGVVTLTRPLTGSTGGGIVTGNGDDVALVVQYEWTPAATDVDGMNYGGRVDGWVTDRLRLGVTGQVETTDTADQRAVGADLRWEKSEETWAEFEYAESDGPGFGSSFSTDGGLITNGGGSTAGGTGTALRLEGRAALSDLGLAADGHVGAYAERREAGFTSLDYQITSDEDLWGVYGEAEVRDGLRLAFHYDDYANDAGKVAREGGAEAEVRTSERLALTFGLLHTDKVTTSETGNRTDVALRATVTQSDVLEWYVYGQGTVARSGLARNDRIGAGATADLGRGWTAEGEVSDGTSGVGGKLRFERAFANNDSYYFGYELDPDRELSGVTLTGRDKGRFVVGGKRQVTDAVSTFAENSYDLFGQRRTLTSAYGVDYAPDQFLSYSGALEIGRVSDPVDGDVDRKALSLGVSYDDEERLAARARVEYRRDRGTTGGTNRDADTVALKATARYKIDEDQRLSFNLDAVTTDTDQSSVLDGDLVDASFGYAYRPVEHDRLNVLLKYRFLYDMYGQRIDGTDTPGPRQKSHVFSVDAEYDLNRHWTIGGKLGFRLSRSAPTSTGALSANDAWLAVANARYHLVHEWDALIEARALGLDQAGTTDYGMLGAVYKHFGNNVELGVGYNFGRFSDDLTDLTQDDRGVFVNLIAKF